MENKKTPTKHAQKGLWFSMVLFVLVAILIAWDIAWDLTTGVTISHIIIELSLMLAAMIGAFYFWNWLKVARRMESNQQRSRGWATISKEQKPGAPPSTPSHEARQRCRIT